MTTTGIVPTELPGLPGLPYTRVAAINAHGTSVGTADNGSGQFRAVRWDASGTPTELQANWAGLPSAISDHAIAVGYIDIDGGWLAARWDADGNITELPSLPGYAYTSANSINNNGISVGFTSTQPNVFGGPYRALQWDRDGNVTDLGTLPDCSYSYATMINARGAVIGFAAIASDLDAP